MTFAGSSVPIGVVLQFGDRNAMPKHTGLIQHALAAGNLRPTLGENPNIPQGEVQIVIGVKP